MMRIHKEGRTPLLAVLTSAVVVSSLMCLIHPVVGWLVGSINFCFFCLMLQFFRHPKVRTPQRPEAVFAPADGKIVNIDKVVESEYLKDKRLLVSIFMSPFNVHVNRVPISGTVRLFVYHPGQYLVAWHPKSSTLNERTTMVIETSNGTELLLRQIAGTLAKRICHYVKKGDKVRAGEEFGFIKFGSRVDVYLPPDTHMKVRLGDKVKGGISLLCDLAEPNASQST